MLESDTSILPPWQGTNHVTGNLSTWNALIRSMHIMHLWAEHQEEMWSTVHGQWLETLHHFTCFLQAYLRMHGALPKLSVAAQLRNHVPRVHLAGWESSVLWHTGVKHHTFEIHFERAAIVTLNKHMPAPSKVLWRENKTDKQEAILLNTMLNLITRQTWTATAY